MSLPTLMIKGNLVPPVDDPALKKELDEWVPYQYILEWFRQRLGKTGITNRVLVLLAQTASGKSTVIPPQLYKAFVQGTKSAGIICTQPRVLTAIENVNEMIKRNNFLRLGDNIGWSTKYNRLRPTSHGLLSVTVGTLTQQMRVMTDDEIMAKYRFILIDETHERDLKTDITIAMLKGLLVRNANNVNCPFVVLMSATFDPQSFLDFFQVPIFTNFVWCRGETAVITEMWDWNGGRTVNNYIQAAADVTERILNENPADPPHHADILIFMPGKAEFAQTNKRLAALNEKMAAAGRPVFVILQIDSAAVQMQNRDYKHLIVVPTRDQTVTIKDKKYTPARRVIIATNVAETGLTLENLKYVVDSGYNREIEYNPVLGIRGLITKPAPQSRIKQRRGRVGRRLPGVFYPLYPKYIHDRLPPLQFPTILIEDITALLLTIISEQLRSKRLERKTEEFIIADIDMVDAPGPDALRAGIDRLYSIGFITPRIDDGPFGLTPLGELAAIIDSVPPESARMILGGYAWGASVLDLITIAAYLLLGSQMISAESPKTRLKPIWAEVYKAGLPAAILAVLDPAAACKYRLLIADDFIDGLVLFAAICAVIERGGIAALQEWCAGVNISTRGAMDFVRLRDEIIDQCLVNNIKLFDNTGTRFASARPDTFMDIVTRLKHCIYDGYRSNVLVRGNCGEYKTVTGLNVCTPKLLRMDEMTQLAKMGPKGCAADKDVSAAAMFVLYKELALKYNWDTGVYDIVVDLVSVLDGFLSIDPDFTN